MAMLYLILTPQYLVFVGITILLLVAKYISLHKSGVLPIPAAGYLWAEEHWPGGDFCVSLRQHAGIGIYLLAVCSYIFWNIACSTTAPAFLPEVLYAVCVIAALCKIVLLTRYSIKQLWISFLWLLPLFLSLGFVMRSNYLLLWLLVFAGKDVAVRFIVACSGIATICGFVTIALLAIFSIIPMEAANDRYLEAGRIQCSFGFVHPNTAGYLVAFAAAALLYLRSTRLKWWDYLLQAAAFVLIAKCINSRGSAVALAVAFIFVVLFQHFPRLLRARAMQWLVCALPALCATISFLSAALFDNEKNIWELLNRLSTGRIDLFHQAFSGLSLSWFGQLARTDVVAALDNTYLSLFYYMGVFCFFLWLAAMTILLWRALQQKAYGLCALALSTLCYAMLESVAPWPAVSVCMWFMPCLLWRHTLPAEIQAK